MDKNETIRLLEYYKGIDDDIRIYSRIVEEHENQYYNTVGAIASDGQPRGKYHITDPTEAAALRVPDYVRKTIEEYRKTIHDLQVLKSEILKEISRLPLRQKVIIFDRYIFGLKWERISERSSYSDRQCINIRDAAVETLRRRFEDNPEISDIIKKGFHFNTERELL